MTRSRPIWGRHRMTGALSNQHANTAVLTISSGRYIEDVRETEGKVRCAHRSVRATLTVLQDCQFVYINVVCARVMCTTDCSPSSARCEVPAAAGSAESQFVSHCEIPCLRTGPRKYSGFCECDRS